MLLVSVIIASAFFISANTVSAIDAVETEEIPVNNLTVTFSKESYEKAINPINTTSLYLSNEGDLRWTKDRWNNDTLQYSEIFINDKDPNKNQLWKMSVKKTSLLITEIRIMNIGRQITVKSEESVVRSDGETTVSVSMIIRKNEQVRIWIEIYGRNGSSLLTSSWLLMSISTLLYCIYNKN